MGAGTVHGRGELMGQKNIENLLFGDETVIIDPMAIQHPNWKDSRKIADFYCSFSSFYQNDYKVDIKNILEDLDINNFIYVENDFVGFGKVGSNVVCMIPYQSENQFVAMMEDLLVNHPKIAVLISKSIHTEKFEELMIKSRNHLNFNYDGVVISSEFPGHTENVTLQ